MSKQKSLFCMLAIFAFFVDMSFAMQAPPTESRIITRLQDIQDKFKSDRLFIGPACVPFVEASAPVIELFKKAYNLCGMHEKVALLQGRPYTVLLEEESMPIVFLPACFDTRKEGLFATCHELGHVRSFYDSHIKKLLPPTDPAQAKKEALVEEEKADRFALKALLRAYPRGSCLAENLAAPLARIIKEISAGVPGDQTEYNPHPHPLYRIMLQYYLEEFAHAGESPYSLLRRSTDAITFSDLGISEQECFAALRKIRSEDPAFVTADRIALKELLHRNRQVQQCFDALTIPLIEIIARIIDTPSPSNQEQLIYFLEEMCRAGENPYTLLVLIFDDEYQNLQTSQGTCIAFLKKFIADNPPLQGKLDDLYTQAMQRRERSEDWCKFKQMFSARCIASGTVYLGVGVLIAINLYNFFKRH